MLTTLVEAACFILKQGGVEGGGCGGEAWKGRVVKLDFICLGIEVGRGREYAQMPKTSLIIIIQLL